MTIRVVLHSANVSRSLPLLPNLSLYFYSHILYERYSMKAVQSKWRIQLFRFKLAQKMDLGFEFQKPNLRIRNSILEISVCNLRKLISNIEIRINIFEILGLCVLEPVCVPIFRQNKYL